MATKLKSYHLRNGWKSKSNSELACNISSKSFFTELCVHTKFLTTNILLLVVKEWKEQGKGRRMGLSSDWLME